VSNSSYKQIIPADGWYFVAKDNNRLIVFAVAVWALTEAGAVIGLVGNIKRDLEDKSTARLVPVPPIVGSYKLREELSVAEIKAFH
jgi:hypothetical protein